MSPVIRHIVFVGCIVVFLFALPWFASAQGDDATATQDPVAETVAAQVQQTVDAVVQQTLDASIGLTETANFNGTVDAIFATRLAQTESAQASQVPPTNTQTPTASPTATHTSTPTRTPTPSITPNLEQTARVRFQQALTATAEIIALTPTATLTPTPTFTPSNTPTATATFTPTPFPQDVAIDAALNYQPLLAFSENTTGNLQRIYTLATDDSAGRFRYILLIYQWDRYQPGSLFNVLPPLPDVNERPWDYHMVLVQLDLQTDEVAYLYDALAYGALQTSAQPLIVAAGDHSFMDCARALLDCRQTTRIDDETRFALLDTQAIATINERLMTLGIELSLDLPVLWDAGQVVLGGDEARAENFDAALALADDALAFEQIYDRERLALYIPQESPQDAFDLILDAACFGAEACSTQVAQSCAATTIDCYVTSARSDLLGRTCSLTGINTVNTRTGAGTGFQQGFTFDAGETQIANAQAEDDAGFTWYRLETGFWVRSDIVTDEEACTELLMVAADSNADEVAALRFNIQRNRNQTPTDLVLAQDGRGLTTPEILSDGLLQVEWYCDNKGYTLDRDDEDWYCTNTDTGERVFALSPIDFDAICRMSYDDPRAIAIQDGNDAVAAFNWRCYTEDA